MSEITSETTIQVARLIQIVIPETETASYTDKLATALEPAQVLQELDTTNVPILSHPTGLTTTGEADIIGNSSLTQEQALANAAAGGNELLGYLKVKQVVEDK